MGYLDNLFASLNMLNPSTDEKGNKLNSQEDVKTMAARLDAPKISGTPGPRPPVPEIAPEDGMPRINNGVLAQLGLPTSSVPADEMPAELPKPALVAAREQRGAPSRMPSQVPASNLDRMAQDAQPTVPTTAPNDPYGAELNDNALKAAMSQRDGTMRNALLARAAQQFAAYGGGGYAKPDFSTAEGLEKNADIPVQDINTRRKAKDQDTEREGSLLKLGTEKEMADANSDISKSVRDFARDKLKIPVKGNETVKQMQTILPLYEKYQETQMKLQDRADARADKKAEKEEKKTAAKSEGEKALDKDFAKSYNEWTTGGKTVAEQNLQLLREAREELRKDPSLTGAAGNLPDFVRNITNEKAIVARDKVHQAAQGSMKATLGSQFTEGEGVRIMNKAFNPKLSTKTNIDKIDSAIQELEERAKNNELKARYFEENGSLKGFKAKPLSFENKQASMVKVKAPNGKIKLIPDTQVEAALAAGGSLAE